MDDREEVRRAAAVANIKSNRAIIGRKKQKRSVANSVDASILSE